MGNAMRYAQTNLQLYNQLIESGYKDFELRLIRQAYELAMTLFTGQFRPNEKSFLAHLIGTASVLASLNETSTVVTAGLLHSVYTHGEFGDGSRGISKGKRTIVCKVVGSEIEKLAVHYAENTWDLDTLRNFQEKLPNVSAADRAVLIIRLADMLEEFSDNGMAYCKKKKFQSALDDIAQLQKIAVKTAESLGYPSLAVSLEKTLKACSSFTAPQGFNTERNMSFTLAPKSYHKTARARFTRFTGEIRRKFSK